MNEPQPLPAPAGQLIEFPNSNRTVPSGAPPEIPPVPLPTSASTVARPAPSGMPNPNQAFLEEVSGQYHLRINPIHKAKAKSISGWDWNGTLKAWTYPLTLAVYNQIVEQFGEMVVGGMPAPPGVVQPVADTQLLEQISKIQQVLESQTAQPAQSLPSEDYQQILLEKERSITALQQQTAQQTELISVLQTQISELHQQIAQQNESAASLQQQVADLNQQLTQKKKKSEVQEWIKGIARETARDPLFAAVADRLPFNQSLPVEALKPLEALLRERLGVGTDLSSFELMKLASERNILSECGQDLAHTLRKLRNQAGHAQVAPHTVAARAVVSLLMLSIVWDELTPDAVHSAQTDPTQKVKATRSRKPKQA